MARSHEQETVPPLFEDAYHVDVAIPTLTAQLGYHETFSDADERFKSDFDSVGWLGEAGCFIEVKRHLGLSEVRHISAKLNSGLRRFCDMADLSTFAVAMRTVCPPDRSPLVGVIAMSYGNSARSALVDLLTDKGRQLQFGWRLWLCPAHGELVELDASQSQPAQPRDPNIKPPVEHGRPARRRNPRPTVSDHISVAEEMGTGNLFRSALSIIERHGGRLKSRVQYLSGSIDDAHIRLYSASSGPGVLLGVEKSRWALVEGAGFEIEGYGHFGHPNLRVRSEADILRFIGALTKRTGSTDASANKGEQSG